MLGNWVLQDPPDCLAAADVACILELSYLIHLTLSSLLIGSLQFKHCLIGPLDDILCDILEAVDARADLNVDVAIELAEEERVVGYHPLVGDYLYHPFSLLAHLYLTGVTTIFWLEMAILGVAVISLLSALQEWLWEIL